MRIMPILCGKLSLKAKKNKQDKITALVISVNLAEGKNPRNKPRISEIDFEQLSIFDQEILKISMGGKIYQIKKSDPSHKEEFLYIVLESC